MYLCKHHRDIIGSCASIIEILLTYICASIITILLAFVQASSQYNWHLCKHHRDIIDIHLCKHHRDIIGICASIITILLAFVQASSRYYWHLCKHHRDIIDMHSYTLQVIATPTMAASAVSKQKFAKDWLYRQKRSDIWLSTAAVMLGHLCPRTSLTTVSVRL